MDEYAILVSVSGVDKYMIGLFRFDVLSFIRKPINQEIFEQVFFAAYKKICNNIVYFDFHYKSQHLKTPCKDILYFESKGRQIKIHCRNGDIDVFNGKLSEVETKVAEGKIPFLRIHQSYRVNYQLIKSKSKAEIRLMDNTVSPISEDRQKEFSQEYVKLLGGEINV